MTIRPEVLAAIERSDANSGVMLIYQERDDYELIRAELLAMDARLANPCTWTQDKWDESWDTACGNKHQFTDGSPAENGHAFCPYCGGSLETSDSAIDAMHNSAREVG